ncbi:phosphoenolpyruvate mutase [Candidatus Roizmanbacteria bacterium]|nr:phosphoenolpyruvate mutase [Candidatus Roizmanbacteria bacterium]
MKKPNIQKTKNSQKQFASSAPVAYRIKKLRDLIKTKKIVRILEAHNGLTGLIAEKTKIRKNNKDIEFDGIWGSSLTDAAAKGKPDISVVDVTSRLFTINEILDVTTKPIIIDIDNGGLVEHFGFTIKTMERLGVSAVVIEDKVGEKRNSLFGTDVYQEQDSVERFCKKIQFGKKRQTTDDLMIIARIENLILKQGIDDALKRAKAYIQAGADGILIHSKEKNPDEILAFAKAYKKITKIIPLVVVPTSYNAITEDELIKAGAKIVIYANHLLRSAYPSMIKTAELILENGRSLEADKLCMPVKEVLTLIPFSEPE